MEKEVTTSKIGIKYGILLGLIFILYGLILQLIGLAANTASGWINFIFLIGFIILAHNEFKDSNDGFMSYGQGLGIASIIIALGAVFSSVFTFIYIKFIDNSMLETMRERQLQELEKQGLSDQEIEQAMDFMGFMESPVAIALMGALFLFFIGFILALIVTAITKNPNPEGQFIDNVR